MEVIENFKFKLIIADDDPEDREMVKEAFEENNFKNEILFLKDGMDLMDYLKFRGKYANGEESLIGLILLDLNMPRKDGRECIDEIKKDIVLKRIPVVILSTSGSKEDILRSYEQGVNGFYYQTYIISPFGKSYPGA